MNNQESRIERDFGKIRPVFDRFFNAGKIEQILITEIPKLAIDLFEGYSRRFISPKDYRQGDFQQLFCINHHLGGQIFVAEQIKQYPDGGMDDELYLCELYQRKIDLGHGEVRFSLNNDEDFFLDKPFVGYTHTEEEFREIGLGVRRLVIMNALTQSLYGLPLHSAIFVQDGEMKEAPMGAWKKLVKLGQAEIFKEAEKDRYRFLDKVDQQNN